MERRSTIALLAGAFAAVCGGNAFAELRYSVEAGAGHSDNITRVEGNEISESLASAGVTLEWHEQRSRLRADVSVDADYVHYLDDTYEGEVVGGLDGTLDFALIPDRLSWIVQDSFGQESTDPFSPVTPDTRENVNYFTTGPALEFLLGGQQARVFATYSMTDYERNPFDSDRVVAGLSFGRSNAAGRGLTINAVTEQVEYKDQPDGDFDRHSVYAAYSVEGARTELSAEAGYTWLDPVNGEKRDDPRFRLEVTRELSSSNTLALRLGTQLTDSSDALRSSLGGGGIDPGSTPSVSSASDPFENRYASLVWSFHRHRTSLSFGGDYSDDTYETQSQLDRERVTWNASVGRDLTSRLSIGLNAILVEEDFESSGLSATTRDLVGSVDWVLGPTLGLRLELSRFDRDSDDATGEYTENRIFLTLSYRYGASRAAAGSAP